MVEGQPAAGVLPGASNVDRSTASRSDRPSRTLEGHDDRDDQGRDAPAVEVREQVGEGRVRREVEALPREQSMDRVRPDAGRSELGRITEAVPLAASAPSRQPVRTRVSHQSPS